jgi:CRISPR-associated protein Cmr5
MTLTLAQKRAAHALKQIEALNGKGGKYKSYVQALPATILMNGLGQALAMELAAADRNKGDHDAHKLIYLHLESWLCGKPPHQAKAPSNLVHSDAPYKGEPDVLKAIISKPEKDYLLAQAEALAYLDWLKTFASAYLEA